MRFTNYQESKMKKYIIILLTVILITQSAFAAEETVITPALSNVKVFLRGAELNYVIRTKVEKGINDFVLTDLASNIDRNSINVSGKGDAIIMSVVQRFDYLSTKVKTKEIKLLEDSLETQNRLLASNTNESDVLKAETDLILSNKNIGNEKIGVSVSELQKMAEYYRKRLTEIKNRSYDLSISALKIKKNIEHLQQQLNEMNNRQNKPVNEIVVTLSSKSNSTVELSLSYVIYDAGWSPLYDLRVENTSSPVAMNYKANVWQNSGMDWNNVLIILSTRNPVTNNNKPELNPWFIDFARPDLRKVAITAQAQGQLTATNEQLSSNKIVNASPSGHFQSMSDYTYVYQNQLSVEFTPQIKYSIPSDSKPHSIALQDFTIPAVYEYYCAPKLDNNAFLIARLTKWADYNLLPGPANIYFENSFVGNSSINPSTTNDTLSISLGRDQSINVTREVIKDYSEDKFLSSNIERTFAYEIKIKNNKKSSEKITVEDQIPLSKNEDIVVKLIESSGAQVNSETGKLKWIVDVEGGKSITKKLVYSVKYPGSKQIPNL
jgi:uncharacterized protein (TIGR02231 family)